MVKRTIRTDETPSQARHAFMVVHIWVEHQPCCNFWPKIPHFNLLSSLIRCDFCGVAFHTWLGRGLLALSQWLMMLLPFQLCTLWNPKSKQSFSFKAHQSTLNHMVDIFALMIDLDAASHFLFILMHFTCVLLRFTTFAMHQTIC